ncbi:endonuclease/exonuclease/phosphatase family protein [Ornithinimicrobium faecis]|uniref:Endonuclease/exonuclease/phosphatase family protein n=2 Tax=Ornithinimicrobium faecis TaxID=2934158 RepID=A0ABY4Z072_9MICO|nr:MULTISPECIES: endonuclease/exonuclease/phosphatase family protein [unclassified Ornithinimicrobium]USQ82095.1 endonuclease/exonuclease/phosphatase family protein [Ornithinimicrobium sp. HY1793]
MDVRFSTFNASLNRGAEGQLLTDLSTPDNEQAQVIAEIIQRNNPDVLLVNEFDYVADGAAAELFRDNYLAVGQNGASPVDYPYYFVAPSNTGIPSGHDLNNDGVVGGGDDAFGFGEFPGQYGMVVFSKFPIDTDAVRTFQNFRWQDMPGNLMPTDFYDEDEQAILRLSSKSHWDVPIQVERNRTVHFLVSHPTPPTFDGPEDRNGKRNHDEIRFWADYVGPKPASSYIYDDAGTGGGLAPGSRFVIAGDQNADPLDGDSVNGAINQLLEHPRINTSNAPTSEGAVEASELQGGINLEHLGDPALDTADFAEPPGNIRVDYVLPSKSLRIRDSGVFWPVSADPLSRLTGTYPFPSSDHRLVWVDVHLPHKG